MNAKSDLLFRRFSRMYDSFFEFGIGPPNVEWQLNDPSGQSSTFIYRRTMTEETLKATTLSDLENQSVQEALAILDRLAQTRQPSDSEFGSPPKLLPDEARPIRPAGAV